MVLTRKNIFGISYAMEEVKNAELTAPKQQNRVVGKPFPKGVSGNPKGRPKGSGYKQKFEKALLKVAQEKGITREEAEIELFKAAYEQALKGNYQFFKDYVDRAYGPVKTDATLNVEKLENLTIVLDNEN